MLFFSTDIFKLQSIYMRTIHENDKGWTISHWLIQATVVTIATIQIPIRLLHAFKSLLKL